MYNELTINTPLREFSIFLQDGFYHNLSPGNIHKHNYTEIHLILGGLAVFRIGEQICRCESGDMLIIPQKALHSCIQQEESVKHTAFQINYDTDEFAIYPINPHILSDFFDEIQHCSETNDYSKLSALMALLCSYFCKSKDINIKRVNDYGFLIQEFFSTHYSDNVHLCDLASLLHLSERQVERLVVECTGKSFRDELAATRITMAKHLIKTSGQSLNEIAQCVGYRSYAGFWKALKKDTPEKNSIIEKQ
ncbi:MAG: AraC family transcriptional regulator [Clostridia bacterium]|nr:AraC family transcriptional regulator [Clostridia bacterium]